MSKSISEINSRLKELNKKYKKSGLTDAVISKKAVISVIGKRNAASGHLSKIGRIGGKKVGKYAHLNLNNSQTFETRSKAHKKKFEKDFIIEMMKKYPFNKDLAAALNITPVTLRRVLKDLGLYIKENAAEKMMRIYSDEERSKLLNSHKNKK